MESECHATAAWPGFASAHEITFLPAEANGSRPSAKSSNTSVSMRIRIFDQPIFAPQVLAFLIRRFPGSEFQFAHPLVSEAPALANGISCEMLQTLFDQPGNAAPSLMSQRFRPCHQFYIDRQVDSSFHMRIIFDYAHNVNQQLFIGGRLWQGRFFSCPLDEYPLRTSIRCVERF